VEDDTCVTVCNTMKFDQIPDAEGADKTSLFDDVFGSGERLVFCAGSTHPGEETMVCDALCSIQRDTPHVHMVLVPRHHERCAEVEQVLVDHGLSFRLLVPRVGREEPQGPVAVLLVNTTGELMNFYAASDVAYVGKSLAGNEGGHNIIEPAIFGKAILHGDNMQNFRAVAAIFREAEAAMEVTSEAEFCEALRDLLADPAQRSALGARARAVVERCRGAIDRTLDRIEPFLEKRP